ncbi:MAG: hypothetical protein ABIA02_03765 [Candidatus Falkowbacteria bacterium]
MENKLENSTLNSNQETVDKKIEKEASTTEIHTEDVEEVSENMNKPSFMLNLSLKATEIYNKAFDAQTYKKGFEKVKSIEKQDVKDFFTKERESAIVEQGGKITYDTITSIAGVKAITDWSLYGLSKVGVKTSMKGDVYKYFAENNMERALLGITNKAVDLKKNIGGKKAEKGTEEKESFLESKKDLIEASKNFKSKLEEINVSDERKKELRKEFVSIMKDHKKQEAELYKGQSQKFDNAMRRYTGQKVNSFKLGKDALNSVLTSTGFFALRGISYVAFSTLERGKKEWDDYSRNAYQEKIGKGEKSEWESNHQELSGDKFKEVLKNTVVGSTKETYNELRYGSKEGETSAEEKERQAKEDAEEIKKLELDGKGFFGKKWYMLKKKSPELAKKSLNRFRALGTLARVAGIGGTSLSAYASDGVVFSKAYDDLLDNVAEKGVSKTATDNMYGAVDRFSKLFSADEWEKRMGAMKSITRKAGNYVLGGEFMGSAEAAETNQDLQHSEKVVDDNNYTAKVEGVLRPIEHEPLVNYDDEIINNAMEKSGQSYYMARSYLDTTNNTLTLDLVNVNKFLQQEEFKKAEELINTIKSNIKRDELIYGKEIFVKVNTKISELDSRLSSQSVDGGLSEKKAIQKEEIAELKKDSQKEQQENEALKSVEEMAKPTNISGKVTLNIGDVDDVKQESVATNVKEAKESEPIVEHKEATPQKEMNDVSKEKEPAESKGFFEKIKGYLHISKDLEKKPQVIRNKIEGREAYEAEKIQAHQEDIDVEQFTVKGVKEEDFKKMFPKFEIDGTKVYDRLPDGKYKLVGTFVNNGFVTENKDLASDIKTKLNLLNVEKADMEVEQSVHGVATKSAVEAPAQPARFEITENIEAESGDSVWSMAEKGLEGNKEYNEFIESLGDENAKEAYKTYYVNLVKNAIVDNPEKYNLSLTDGKVDFSKLTIDDLNKIKWQDAFDEALEGKEFNKNVLNSGQVESITENNEKLREFFKDPKNKDVPGTEKNYEKVLRGEGDKILDEMEKVEAGPEVVAEERAVVTDLSKIHEDQSLSEQRNELDRLNKRSRGLVDQIEEAKQKGNNELLEELRGKREEINTEKTELKREYHSSFIDDLKEKGIDEKNAKAIFSITESGRNQDLLKILTKNPEFYDQVKGFEGDIEKIKGIIEINKGQVMEGARKIFEVDVNDNNYEVKNGIYRIKDVQKGFDIVFKKTDNGIKFGVDGPLGRNWGAGGKTLRSHIDADLTNENIVKAKSVIKEMFESLRRNKK